MSSENMQQIYKRTTMPKRDFKYKLFSLLYSEITLGAKVLTHAGEGVVMTKAYECVHGEGQPWWVCAHLDCIFQFLKIFSIKKKNGKDWGNGGFIDVTSEVVKFWTQNYFWELNEAIDVTYILWFLHCCFYLYFPSRHTTSFQRL